MRTRTAMWLILIVCAAVSADEKLITQSSIQEFRVFQNVEGQTVRAKIVKVQEPAKTLTLRTEDNKTRTLSIATLCEADQAYVLEWQSISDFFNPSLFRIEVDSKSDRESITDLFLRYEEPVIYSFSFHNRSTSDMHELMVEYDFMYEIRNLNQPEPHVDQKSKGGKLEIKSLPCGVRRVCKTEPIMFATEDLYEYYKGGKKPTVKFLGIRLRIYLPLEDDKKAMREFYSPTNGTKNIRARKMSLENDRHRNKDSWRLSAHPTCVTAWKNFKRSGAYCGSVYAANKY